MVDLMKPLAATLLLGLASCANLVQQTDSPSSTASPLAQPAGANLTPGRDVIGETLATAMTPAEQTGLRPAAVDSSKRFEYADLYVSLTDPQGQRALAPYFLKSDVWTIDKFEQLSDTLRHYRFRRLAGPDGKSLPEVDPFNPPKRQ